MLTSGPGLILGLRPANERWRYFVTTSLIDWVQAQNQLCGQNTYSRFHFHVFCGVGMMFDVTAHHKPSQSLILKRKGCVTHYHTDQIKSCQLLKLLAIPTEWDTENTLISKWIWRWWWLNKANLRDLIAATGLVILLKLDSNRLFFSPCDLEIWWMTPKNNRACLLYYIKLCASFQIHQWIQTGVTVRKRPIWVKFDDFF